MFFTKLALITVALVGSAACLALPPNLQDGAYSTNGTINPATGFAHYTYHGPLGAKVDLSRDVGDAASSRRDLQTASPAEADLAKRRANPGPNCQGGGPSRSDLDNARIAWDQNWNGVPVKQSSSGWGYYTVVGQAKAYACVYTTNQYTLSGAMMDADMGVCDANCGGTSLCFYSTPGGPTNYGRTFTNFGIC